MIYAIPVLGWIIGLFFHISLCIPLYFAWNGVAPTYFQHILPPEWLHIPFWHMVGLTVCAAIMKTIVYPRFFNINPPENRRDELAEGIRALDPQQVINERK